MIQPTKANNKITEKIGKYFREFFSAEIEISKELEEVFERFKTRFQREINSKHSAKLWAVGLIKLTAERYRIPCDFVKLSKVFEILENEFEDGSKAVMELFELNRDKARFNHSIHEFWNSLTPNAQLAPIDQVKRLQDQIMGANFERDWSRAFRLYEEMQRIFPKNSTAFIGRCRSLFFLEKFDEALNVISDAQEAGLDSPELDEIKAEALQKMGREEEAEQVYLRMLKQPHFPPSAHSLARFGLALYNSKRGKLENAKEHLKIAISLDPSHSDAIRRLAEIHRELGDFEEARDVFQQLSKISSDHFSIFIDLARIEEDLGHINEAVSALEEAVSRDKDLLNARRHLVRLYRQLGDEIGVSRHREAILSSNVENPESGPVRMEFFLLEYSVTKNHQELVKALSLGRKIIGISPGQKNVMFLTALALEKGGDLDGSLEAMRAIMLQDAPEFIRLVDFYSSLWETLDRKLLLNRHKEILSKSDWDELDVAIHDCLSS